MGAYSPLYSLPQERCFRLAFQSPYVSYKCKYGEEVEAVVAVEEPWEVCSQMEQAEGAEEEAVAHTHCKASPRRV